MLMNVGSAISDNAYIYVYTYVGYLDVPNSILVYYTIYVYHYYFQVHICACINVMYFILFVIVCIYL